MRKYPVFIGLISSFLFSCSKNDPPVVYTGRIVHAKDSTAYANTKFLIYATQETAKSVRQATEAFYTNADGYFRIEFIPKSNYVSICYEDLATHVPEAEVGRTDKYHSGSYDFGTMYAKR